MTTNVLLVVIITITCNLAILYLPFDVKKRALLSLIVGAVLGICVLTHNARNNEVPVLMHEKMAQNPTAKAAMMTTFNLSEDKLNTNTQVPTPIELGVTLTVVLALVFTPILLNVVKNDNDDNDKETAKKVHQVAFSINILAIIVLLSLYYGLKLPFVPWYKKASKENELSPALT